LATKKEFLLERLKGQKNNVRANNFNLLIRPYTLNRLRTASSICGFERKMNIIMNKKKQQTLE
jgi:hypothetical protein